MIPKTLQHSNEERKEVLSSQCGEFKKYQVSKVRQLADGYGNGICKHVLYYCSPNWITATSLQTNALVFSRNRAEDISSASISPDGFVYCSVTEMGRYYIAKVGPKVSIMNEITVKFSGITADDKGNIYGWITDNMTFCKIDSRDNVSRIPVSDAAILDFTDPSLNKGYHVYGMSFNIAKDQILVFNSSRIFSISPTDGFLEEIKYNTAFPTKSFSEIQAHTNGDIYLLHQCGTLCKLDANTLELNPLVKLSEDNVWYSNCCVISADEWYVIINKEVMHIREVCSWQILKLLWVGKMKNGTECCLHVLPNDIIKLISTFL